MAWISFSSRTNIVYFWFLDYCASWITWKIDLCGMYNLVHLWGGDKLKIEFQTHYGYFEHVVMPFSFINALAFFQHLMNAFHEYFDDFVVCYIFDIFIFSKYMKDHEHHVCLALEIYREIKLYAKLKKCEFHQTKMEFLIYIIFRYNIPLWQKVAPMTPFMIRNLSHICFNN